MLVAAHHRRPKGAIVDAAATVAFAGRGGLVQVLGGVCCWSHVAAGDAGAS